MKSNNPAEEPCAAGGIGENVEREGLKFWRFIQETKSLLYPLWTGPTVSQSRRQRASHLRLNIDEIHFCSGKRNFTPENASFQVRKRNRTKI